MSNDNSDTSSLALPSANEILRAMSIPPMDDCEVAELETVEKKLPPPLPPGTIHRRLSDARLSSQRRNSADERVRELILHEDEAVARGPPGVMNEIITATITSPPKTMSSNVQSIEKRVQDLSIQENNNNNMKRITISSPPGSINRRSVDARSSHRESATIRLRDLMLHEDEVVARGPPSIVPSSTTTTTSSSPPGKIHRRLSDTRPRRDSADLRVQELILHEDEAVARGPPGVITQRPPGVQPSNQPPGNLRHVSIATKEVLENL